MGRAGNYAAHDSARAGLTDTLDECRLLDEAADYCTPIPPERWWISPSLLASWWWSVVAGWVWFGSEGGPGGGVGEVVAAVGVAVQLLVAFVEHQVVGFAGEGAVGDGGGSALLDGVRWWASDQVMGRSQ